MKTLTQLGAELSEKRAQFEAINKEAGPDINVDAITSLQGTPEEKLKSFSDIAEELRAIEKEYNNLLDISNLGKSNAAALKGMNEPVNDAARPSTPDIRVKRYRYTTVKNFKGEDSEERAYRFGLWFAACASQDKGLQEKAAGMGLVIEKAAHNEGSNAAGGFLVPTEFGGDMVDLREEYGVFRKNTKIVPMASDTRTDPRRTGGVTAYFMQESGAGTEALKGWDQISLTAKKLMSLVKYTSELAEDAYINIGDDLIGEINYAFAVKEDQCGFVGDGSSTYGGIEGILPKLLRVFTTSGGTGLVLASGNAYSEIVLGDLMKVAGALPQYAEKDAKWYCSKRFWEEVVAKIILSAGGVSALEMIAGVRRQFLGYPVEIVQVMPSVEGNSQVPLILGSLKQGTRMGVRRGTQIALSKDAAFTTDELLIRGTERFDINVHDVGETGTAGPIVGLLTAAS